jgi:lysine 2,3-aminomutase
VHQVSRCDTERGISYWTKNYRTAVDADDELALEREFEYYDPIYLLPESGQRWWRERALDLAAAAVREPAHASA